MNVKGQIKEYITAQPESKQSDMQALHSIIQKLMPACYQIGLSANTTGISVYIMGINDKTYLTKTYGKKLGKASVTGYCIKFKTLKDINIEILEAAIRYGFEATS